MLVTIFFKILFGKLVHIFGQLVHIFGELAHIFGELVHISLRETSFRNDFSKQVSKNLRAITGNRGYSPSGILGS